jgi:FkbM family methyltransferase
MDQKYKVAFVLGSTAHGTMILNHLDRQTMQEQTYGVGYELLRDSSYEFKECEVLCQLLEQRRRHFGDGVIVVDAGANIGTHTVSLARAMTDWGEVIAFEPQERIYYALCGNIAINNTFNAWAINNALGASDGTMQIPSVDYQRAASYGSLELAIAAQHASAYHGENVDITVRRLDSFNLPRIDLLKLDIEGMELEALKGARNTIAEHAPILFIEVLKQNIEEVQKTLNTYGYHYGPISRNLIAVHQDDPTLTSIKRKT